MRSFRLGWFGLLIAVFAATSCSPTGSPGSASPASPSAPVPAASPSPSAFASYSANRISIRYPVSWRLQPPSSGRSDFSLYSRDYKAGGGTEIQTIQQGALIVFSQTDIPQKSVTADNYPTSRLAGYVDGKVVVIGGRKAFQARLSNAPWFDITSTIFFRDDGTEVMVDIFYPVAQPATHGEEYIQLLASLVYE